MSAPQLQFGDFDELRCFGRALVQDERRPLGESVAAQLTDQLIRKAMTGVVDEGGVCGSRARVVVFARFIALHRRYVFKAFTEENDYGWPDPSLGRSDRRVKAAVQSLPLELREALLLVSLAGFAHADAAEALGISLCQFVARLDKARRQLAERLDESVEADEAEVWARAPHLRIVK